MCGFRLNARLEADSRLVSILGLCQLRLMNDSRWPWFLLVPQRAEAEEIYHLTPLDQTLLTFEAGETARALKRVTECDKINIGALGNQVRQLHLHVIARSSGDTGWPGPVWGVGKAEPYDTNSANALIEAIIKEI
ncbi:HIT domain-containing protein [Hoeflea poritis]|uniref:HIT family protein n=1 Tax=Hoeflea poritis TaxID=2993659 RepID=A0ABT4VU96_9HYPH|nr:HIT family protein [Hoeflea poritis]MDA4848277.1 HIT family protein [Hoeflea poritis]